MCGEIGRQKFLKLPYRVSVTAAVTVHTELFRSQTYFPKDNAHWMIIIIGSMSCLQSPGAR